MKEHVPVPKSVLTKLLDHQRAMGSAFSLELALTHLMLDWLSGEKRSRQQYADIWGWSKTKVQEHMPALHDTAEELLSMKMAMDDLDPLDMPSLELFPGLPFTKPTPPKSERSTRKHNKKFFERDSFEFKCAKAFTAKMIENFGITTKQYDRDPEAALQAYAKVFYDLQKSDGHSRDTIVAVVKYLFNKDGWWISSGNFASPTKFRRKTRSTDRYVFNRLLTQMNNERNRKPRQQQPSVDSIAESARETLRLLNTDEAD